MQLFRSSRLSCCTRFNPRPSAASWAKRQLVLRTAIQRQSVLQKGADNRPHARTFANHHLTIVLAAAHSASGVSASRCVSLKDRRFLWLTAPTRSLGGWKCARGQPIEPVSQVVQTSAAYLKWPFPLVSVTSHWAGPCEENRTRRNIGLDGLMNIVIDPPRV